jgi:hypothetical protein
MPQAFKFIRVLFLLLMVAILTGTSCAPVKKNPYATKKKAQSSIINASQLGRNKLYFSTSYQKKLAKSYKRK